VGYNIPPIRLEIEKVAKNLGRP